MITRQEFMRRKAEIEERMKQSRLAQQKEVRILNEEFDNRLEELALAHRRRRQALFLERDRKRLDIECRYKNIRMSLFIEDSDLVSQWREQLSPDMPGRENTRIHFPENREEKGGAL